MHPPATSMIAWVPSPAGAAGGAASGVAAGGAGEKSGFGVVDGRSGQGTDATELAVGCVMAPGARPKKPRTYAAPRSAARPSGPPMSSHEVGIPLRREGNGGGLRREKPGLTDPAW
jgi:hypothetical protein